MGPRRPVHQEWVTEVHVASGSRGRHDLPIEGGRRQKRIERGPLQPVIPCSPEHGSHVHVAASKRCVGESSALTSVNRNSDSSARVGECTLAHVFSARDVPLSKCQPAYPGSSSLGTARECDRRRLASVATRYGRSAGCTHPTAPATCFGTASRIATKPSATNCPSSASASTSRASSIPAVSTSVSGAANPRLRPNNLLLDQHGPSLNAGSVTSRKHRATAVSAAFVAPRCGDAGPARLP